MSDNWLDEIKWTDDGLVPVIAQEAGSGDVLTGFVVPILGGACQAEDRFLA